MCIHPSTCQHPLHPIHGTLQFLYMYVWGLARVIVTTSTQLHHPKPDKQLPASVLYYPIVPLTNNEVTVRFLWEWLNVRTRRFFPKLNKGSWQVLLNISSDHQLPSSPVTPHPASGSWVPESLNVCAWVNIVYTHTEPRLDCAQENLSWSLASLWSVFMRVVTQYRKENRKEKGRRNDMETERKDSRQKIGELGLTGACVQSDQLHILYCSQQ